MSLSQCIFCPLPSYSWVTFWILNASSKIPKKTNGIVLKEQNAWKFKTGCQPCSGTAWRGGCWAGGCGWVRRWLLCRSRGPCCLCLRRFFVLPFFPHLTLLLLLPGFGPGWDGQVGGLLEGRDSQRSVCGEAVGPLKGTSCCCISWMWHQDPKGITGLFMEQAGQRGFEREWLGPLKSQTEQQLPTPKYKYRNLSVKMQSQREWHGGTGPAWDAIRQLVLGLWCQNQGCGGARSCNSHLDVRGRDKISWQSYMTRKQKSLLSSVLYPPEH